MKIISIGVGAFMVLAVAGLVAGTGFFVDGGGNVVANSLPVMGPS